MKTLVSVIALMVVVLLAAPAMGEESEAQIERQVYEDAIDDEIAQSRQMASLLSSRSSNLRKKGHREASKAIFMEMHRDELVDDMMATRLAPKTYKVERFLNDRFSCNCYATWAAK
jgi:hypothetical protein